MEPRIVNLKHLGFDQAVAREREDVERVISQERLVHDAIERRLRHEKLQAGVADAPHRADRRRETLSRLSRGEVRAEQDRSRAEREEMTNSEVRRERDFVRARTGDDTDAALRQERESNAEALRTQQLRLDCAEDALVRQVASNERQRSSSGELKRLQGAALRRRSQRPDEVERLRDRQARTDRALEEERTQDEPPSKKVSGDDGLKADAIMRGKRDRTDAGLRDERDQANEILSQERAYVDEYLREDGAAIGAERLAADRTRLRSLDARLRAERRFSDELLREQRARTDQARRGRRTKSSG